MTFRAVPLAAAAALVLMPFRADAQLTVLGQSTQAGGGLGGVATVLTLQSPNNSSVETGCVAPDGIGACGFPSSTLLTGSSQT